MTLWTKIKKYLTEEVPSDGNSQKATIVALAGTIGSPTAFIPPTIIQENNKKENKNED